MTVLLQLTALEDAPPHLDWLGDAERTRLAGISDASRAAQFVAGHCLARRLAAEFAGGLPEQWRLTVGDDGRRRLEHAHAAPLFTSISHVPSALAVAVGPQPLGVDLEARGPSRDWQGLARTMFSPAEVRALEASPDDEREQTFLRLWTLKEAWAKRSGRGLQRQAARRCTALACGAADAEAWTWRLPDGGWLSLAAWRGARIDVRGDVLDDGPWRYVEAAP